jgi:type II secretory pathway component PulF
MNLSLSLPEFDLTAICRGWARLKFTSKERTDLYRRLAGLMRNKVQLQKALESLCYYASDRDSNPNTPRAVALQSILDGVLDGKSLAEALEGWAPDAERMLIQAGEMSGDLPGILDRAVEVTTAASAMVKAIAGALGYPSLLMVAIVGVLFSFGQFVFPEFALSLPMEQWTGIGGQMAVLVQVTQTWFLPACIAVPIAIALLFKTMPIWTGKIRRRLDRFPPWSLYRLLVGTQFLLAVSALLNGGMQESEILEQLLGFVRPWLRERLQAALNGIQEGRCLGAALYEAGYEFPAREVNEDLEIYAQTKEYEISVDRLARSWVATGVERVKAQSQIMFNLMIVVFGLTITWIVLGMFDLQDQITATANMNF